MNNRIKFADAIQSFLMKNVSIDGFENIYFEVEKNMKVTNDPDHGVVKDIFWQVWQMYDDLTDDFLMADDEIKEDLERFMCFLRSDCVNKWPPLTKTCDSLKSFFSFGLWNNKRRRDLEKIGEIEAWPFISQEEYMKNKHGLDIGCY